MKNRSFAVFALALLALASINHPLSTCFAQGTAFTYQGQLNSGGSPANGSYDIAFTLYTTNVTGTAIAGPVTNTAVAVTNGLFTTLVDFGPGAFTGMSNWLAIAVSTNAANSFTNLTPRQQVTPTPYAITAENVSGAVAASSISGTLANGNLPASPSVSGTVTAGSFTGNGANVTNVNAATLNGLNATNFWQLGGNNVAGGQFLGSANGQAVIVKVNNQEAMRYEPTTDTPNVVGGYSGNYVQPGLPGVTIGGGGTVLGGQPNIVTNNGQYGVIAGGYHNTVTNYGGAILGGSVNFAGGFFATIGGGQVHTNLGNYGFIGGGELNAIQNNASYSMIGGGNQNTIQINSSGSTIGGGYQNYIGPNTTNSTIGGGHQNFIGPNAFGSTIGGGYQNLIQANATTSMIGGGSYNYIYGNGGFIGGGGYDGLTYAGNNNYGNAAVIVGGLGNLIASGGNYSVIGGGILNSASGIGSFIGGGGYDGVTSAGNTNFGNAAVIGGGLGNLIASGGNESVIGGGSGNSIQPGGYGSFLGGGSQNSIQPNANNSVLGGGGNNSIQTNAFFSFLGGGSGNSIQTGDTYSVLGGGAGNSIQPGGYESFLGGGSQNSIQPNVNNSVLGGGYLNSIGASADYCVIPGGYNNSIGNNLSYSFAAGNRAQANHNGTFVWADSQNAAFASTASDQFCIRSQGGVQVDPSTSVYFGSLSRQMLNLWSTQYGIGVQASTLYNRTSPGGGFAWFQGGVHNNAQDNAGAGGTVMMTLDSSGNLRTTTGTIASLSDRNAKTDLQTVDAQEVLARVSALPVATWRYKTADPTQRHMGPMAQDFYAAFKVGLDDKSICTVDEGGVALAAIQGLNEKLESGKRKAETQMEQLAAENAELKQRLDALEKLILNQTPK